MKTLKLTAVLLAALALAATGLAYASPLFKQISIITLTAKKEGKPTGLLVTLESSDAGAVQPQGLKTLTIKLPSKTAFNFKSRAIKLCSASEIEIKATLGKACPAKSEIGTGSAVANGAPVLPVIPEDAVAYAGTGHRIVFLLTPATSAGEVLVLYGKVVGATVTTSVPVIIAGGLNIVITELKLTVAKIGTGANAFITAGRCAAGKFTVKANFLYQTGATLALSSSSKCTK